MNTAINITSRLFLVTCVLLIAQFCSYAQLKADFTADVTKGCSPLVVNFSDASTGNPTSWKWDFGNKTPPVFGQSVSTTYTTPGSYSVTLTISDGSATHTVIKTGYIVVPDQPIVDFTSDKNSGCYPQTIQFTDLTNDQGGVVTNWLWDFGDGFIDSTKNPVHTYNSPGNYNVTLSIKNEFGCEKSLGKQNFISIQGAAFADFTNSISASCKPPSTIQFNNFSSGPGPLSYSWNFGDGAVSNQPSPQHQFTKTGTFLVLLKVSTLGGCTDTASKEITIGTVNADFNAQTQSCHGKPITFTNTSSPLPDRARWDFGDGTTADDISPVKIYNTPGVYQVKMVADFGGCLDSITKSITIQDKFSFDFSAMPQRNCKSPLTVNFTSATNGGQVFKWIFGDGSTSTLPNPSHNYVNFTTYSVTLIVINPSGCFDTLTKPNFVNYQNPVLRLRNLPAQGCIPFTTTLRSRINFQDSVVSYLWDLGDGTTSTDSTPTHTYSNVGAYKIKLTITTALGCTKTVIRDSGVLAGTKPRADFVASPLDVCASIPINFTDQSTGGVNDWLWNFGDGEQSKEKDPIHIFQDTGYFSVKLIVRSTGCPDSITRQKYVHIKPPVPKFTPIIDCTQPFTRSFKNASIGADNYLWNFGDGSPTSTAKTPPPHVFKDTGTYNVSLTVNNVNNGCSNTLIVPVQIINQKADFISLSQNLCKGSRNGFTTLNIIDKYITNYEWSFGDGVISSQNNDTVFYAYPRNGLFDVGLKITDTLGCRDSIVKPGFSKVEGPTVFFTTDKGGGCLNQQTTFLDSSVSDGSHPIVQWVWDYGDGTVTSYTVPPFIHTYTSQGIYTVSLKVFDSNGCTDSLTRNNYFEISVPIADFRTIDTASCPGKNIAFTNLSSGPQLTSRWEFGDGSTSTSPNPVYQYTANGIYTVKLFISDAYGCIDSMIKQNYINITTPIADFSVNDSISPCSPFQVTFVNKSQFYRTAFFEFGDGGTSIVTPSSQSPQHVYIIPGTYTVVMTATGQGGCTDVKRINIIVKGPQGSFTSTNTKGCNSLTTRFVATTKGTTSLIWDFGDGKVLDTKDSIVDHTYTLAGDYFPKVILIDRNCRVPIFGLDTISVYNVKAAFSQSSVLACNTGAISFTDSSQSNDQIIGYRWDFGDGAFSNDQNPSHFYGTPGTYFAELTITTAFGCTSTVRSNQPIKIIASPQIQITGDSAACVPATLTLKGELIVPDTSVINWQWDFGNGAASTLQQPPAQTYAVAGSYTATLTATNSSGCMDTAYKSIIAYPIPIVTAIRDTFVCIGNSVTLQATGAATYTWSPSASLSCTICQSTNASPVDNTIYTVMGTSTDGCSANDQLEVLVKKPFNISVSPADSICLGSGITISATGAEVYLWSPAAGLDNSAKPDPFAMPTQSTNYFIVGSDNKGCFQDTASVLISVFPLPTVNVGPDVTINIGQSTTIKPQLSADVVDYTWSPTTGIVFISDSSLTVKPVISTEYNLLVTNNGNCKAEDKLTVFVICNNANVYIPNTFSPNNDGVNDRFYPRGTGLFKIRGLKVFNRWGEMVFQNTNLNPNASNDGWDGTYKSKPLSPDVFVYQVDIVCENGSVLSYKGNIALIR